MFLSLLLFVMIATITPGGATTLATASGVQFGFLRSIPMMLGIVLGLATLAAVSAAGLGGVLHAEPALMWIMKTTGSAYLLFLAWRIGSSGPPSDAFGSSRAPVTVLGGAFLLWLNPKAWAMTLGAAASFSALTENPLMFGAVLGVAFGGGAMISLSLWCAAGRTFSRVLRTERHWRYVNIALGVLLASSIIPIWFE